MSFALGLIKTDYQEVKFVISHQYCLLEMVNTSFNTVIRY
jgi:hypothetical protein